MYFENVPNLTTNVSTLRIAPKITASRCRYVGIVLPFSPVTYMILIQVVFFKSLMIKISNITNVIETKSKVKHIHNPLNVITLQQFVRTFITTYNCLYLGLLNYTTINELHSIWY